MMMIPEVTPGSHSRRKLIDTRPTKIGAIHPPWQGDETAPV